MPMQIYYGLCTFYSVNRQPRTTMLISIVLYKHNKSTGNVHVRLENSVRVGPVAAAHHFVCNIKEVETDSKDIDGLLEEKVLCD